MKMLIELRKDEEVQELRREWKEKFTEPFLLWNWDCFEGINNYKQRIKLAIESGDSRKICETCSSQMCKRRILN